MDLYSLLLPYMWVIVAIVIGVAVAIALVIITSIVIYWNSRQEEREMERRVKESVEEAKRTHHDLMGRLQRDNQMHSARFERDYEQKKALVRGNLYAPDYKKSEGKEKLNG